VDTETFSPALERRVVRASLGLADDAFVLFTVRNLVPRMGLEALLQTVAQLRQEIPHLLVLIGGSGPLRVTLEAQVEALGLQSAVRLLGFVPEELLPDYYRAADLFVLPTMQLEGFGLVTVEALASGTPVFGTRIGATEEILGQLDPALLSSGTDTVSLATGILALYRRFMAEPGARARLSRAGRALVLRHFTWARHCERLTAVLDEVRQRD
jgi:glycosyltransferase involved in cell wall biosynthesis